VKKLFLQMMLAALALSRKIMNCCCYARSAAIVAEAGEIAAVEETRSVITLTLDAEEKFPAPRLSRLLLRFGALAAADVVPQTLLPN
jgi:hypothetical protein